MSETAEKIVATGGGDSAGRVRAGSRAQVGGSSRIHGAAAAQPALTPRAASK